MSLFNLRGQLGEPVTVTVVGKFGSQSANAIIVAAYPDLQLNQTDAETLFGLTNFDHINHAYAVISGPIDE